METAPDKKPRIKVEKREHVSPIAQIVALIHAVILSIIVTGLLMYIGGADIKAGFIALFEGAFGSWQAIVKSLVKATPLILTGLGTVVTFVQRFGISVRKANYMSAPSLRIGHICNLIIYPLLF